MTTRDRTILGVLAAIGLLAAFWFVGISPKRSELKKLDAQVAQSEQNLASARQEAAQFAQDRLAFPAAYTEMVRLGKAVPKDADVPSLVVQLEDAAREADVDFRTVKVSNSGGGGSPASTQSAPPPPATPAPSTAASSGATGQSGAGGSSTSPAGTTGPSPSPSPSGGAGSTSSTPPASTGTTGAAPVTAPANATAAATLPIGTQVGPAELPVLKMSLIFQGNFFKMADLVHNVRALVERQDHRLLVSGRLLTVDGIGFEKGDAGFPQVKVTMLTTAYLLPVNQNLLAGATPQGPAGATSTPASTTGGAATPPAAVVTP
jgi:hypothetical protein